MSQKSGIHRILEIPIFYNFVQWLFFHKKTSLIFNKLIADSKHGIVLDVGCGPGNQSNLFKNSKVYIGVDISEVNINEAKKLYGGIGEFYILSATEIDKLSCSNFDLVILKGVFHHLSDDEVSEFLKKVSDKLSQNGVVVTTDPTFIKGRFLANFLTSQDRGLHVRTPMELSAITDRYLKTIECNVVKQNFPPYQRVLMKLGANV